MLVKSVRLLFWLAVLIALIWLYFGAAEKRSQVADLVLLNGKIFTVDDHVPLAEALAANDGMIIAIGDDRDIRPYIGSGTEVIDLDGRLAIPGFIEGHAHFLSLGQSLMRLDLRDVATWQDIVAKVEAEVPRKKPGEWIIGRGWHQDKWQSAPQPNVHGLPLHHELSRISPDNPVLLTHASGHSCIANHRAMQLAGINSDTPDPEGGTIIRDSGGAAIGVFLETAMNALYAARDSALSYRTAEDTERITRDAVDRAADECLANGITSFQDAGASFQTIDLLRQMAQEGSLKLRLWVMISEDNDSLNEKLDQYRIIREGDSHLTVRAIKRLIDGALGSHGAWLLQPYSDLSTSSGLNTEPIQSMKETARLAIEYDFQLCTHAIGDRGNREVLDIYEEAFAKYPDRIDLRWRIEHAQHLHPNDIERFGQLGVIASMQGIHCTSDGPWVPKRLGDERTAQGAYVWQRLWQSGTIISNGTDAPVENVDPIANFHALITRKLADGTSFYPDQCLTREQALRAYTINCAHAAFEEDIKGSLSVGKLADITVLSKDILTVDEAEILDTQVEYTIVGGTIMHRR